MNEKFKYRFNKLSLINGILFFFTGIAYAWSKGLYDWQAYVWWLGSIGWSYQYFLHREYSLLIDDEKISINRGLWGDKKILVNDIERVDTQKKYFLLKLKNYINHLLRKNQFQNLNLF